MIHLVGFFEILDYIKSVFCFKVTKGHELAFRLSAATEIETEKMKPLLIILELLRKILIYGSTFEIMGVMKGTASIREPPLQ